jgi:hypothetical protein
MKEGEVKGKTKERGRSTYSTRTCLYPIKWRTHARTHSLARGSNEEDKISTYKPTSRSCSAVEPETIRTCGFGD